MKGASQVSYAIVSEYIYLQKNRKRGEFLAFIYCSKMQKCLSFRGLRPLHPHQSSALDPLGGFSSAPQTPSCVQQWPTVIASCACGATPDPVSGNNWVMTKYASQFFKAGYGPATLLTYWVCRGEFEIAAVNLNLPQRIWIWRDEFRFAAVKLNLPWCTWNCCGNLKLPQWI